VIKKSRWSGGARSDRSVKRAVDRIEYAETAARYEYLNLTNGEAGQGLSDEEIREICRCLESRRLFLAGYVDCAFSRCAMNIRE
jgi:hypothetical protein